jgi:hypothetical protein
MAIVGISVTKEGAFRDSVQPFSNVYFYNNNLGGAPDETGALAMIDEIVTFEKQIHASTVTFAYARCWHQTLLQATTVMLAQKPLSGVGAAGDVGNMDRERAYLLRWRAGNDSRGNPVYLRKWYHTFGGFGSQYTTVATGVLANTTTILAASRTAIETKAAEMTNLAAGGGGWELCAKSGRGHDFATPNCHPYLEHHQLGDQWRGD